MEAGVEGHTWFVLMADWPWRAFLPRHHKASQPRRAEGGHGDRPVQLLAGREPRGPHSRTQPAWTRVPWLVVFGDSVPSSSWSRCKHALASRWTRGACLPSHWSTSADFRTGLAALWPGPPPPPTPLGCARYLAYNSEKRGGMNE